MKKCVRPKQVESIVGKGQGAVLVMINSVCGCAAGNARPAAKAATASTMKITQ